MRHHTDPERDEPQRFQRLKAWHQRAHANPFTSAITKVIVTLVGVAVLCAGLVMMVTPGPGIVGIVLGLAILATEWAWAERAVFHARQQAANAAAKAREMDPAVRRRRLAVAGLGISLIGAGAWAYVYNYDWPQWSVWAWDQAQSMAGFLPELPGM